LSKPIKAITLPQSHPLRFLPFPPLYCPIAPNRPPAINGRMLADDTSSISPPFSPCCYLSSSSGSHPPLCTCSTPLHALEHPSHRHRRLCISPPPDAVGEVLRRPIFSFSDAIVSLT
jgi:hypothetical protein